MRVIIFTILAAVVGVQSEVAPGFTENKVVGKAYKLVYQAQKWADANEECKRLGGGASLAAPVSLEELQFLEQMVRGMSYKNITGTQYIEVVWLEFNKLRKNRDAERSSGKVEYSADPKEPHCGGMETMHFGIMEDSMCNLAQPYICEIKLPTTTTAI